MSKNSSRLLDYALEYIELDWSIIPLRPNDKKPAISWGVYQRRLPSKEEVTNWFTGEETYNIAIITGRVSNLIVIDVDDPEKAKRLNLPKTATVQTARGFHYYYQYPDGVIIPSKHYEDLGIDLKGDGGYVVAPPSMHPSGVQYKWLVPPDNIVDFPEHLIEQFQEKKAVLDGLYPNWKIENAFVQYPELNEGVDEGERNTTCAHLAGKLIASGFYFKEEVLEILLRWNQLNIPPLPEKEVATVVNSIWKIDEEKRRKEEHLEQAELDVIKTPGGYAIKSRDGYKHISNFVIELDEIVTIVGDLEEVRKFRGRLVLDDGSELPFEIKTKDFADSRKLKQEIVDQGLGRVKFDPKKLPEIEKATLYYSYPEKKTIYKTFGYYDNEFLSPSVIIRDGEIIPNKEKIVELGDIPLDLKIISEERLKETAHHLKEDFLELTEHQVTYSILAQVHLAPIFPLLDKAERYALWLVGESGVGKTFTARLAQCFFGNFNSEDALNNWSSTPNEIQWEGFFYNSAVYVIDDYKLGTTQTKGVIRILQSLSDGGGRRRLRANITKQQTYYIRGMVLATAQDLIENEDSVTARSIIVYFPKLAQKVEKGKKCLKHCIDYPGYTAHFIAWSQKKGKEYFRKKKEELEDFFRPRFKDLPNGGRIINNFSLNFLGFWAMLEFWAEVGIITKKESEAMYAEHQEIVKRLAEQMGEAIREERGSDVFIKTLSELIYSGRVIIIGLRSHLNPENSRAHVVGFCKEEEPDKIYLYPGIAYQEINWFLQQSGRRFPVSVKTLAQQLVEDGIILETEKGQVSKKVQYLGQRRRCWVIAKNKLIEKGDEPEVFLGQPIIDREGQKPPTGPWEEEISWPE